MEQRVLDFIAKAQFKIGELGEKMLSKSSRAIRIIEEDYILMRDLQAFIEYLFESNWTVEGTPFNWNSNDEDVLRQIEAYELRAQLDIVPRLDYPSQQTIVTIIEGESGTGGSGLPDGAAVGTYLTGSASGQPIWKTFDIFLSDFNDI